jgi:signal peptide peptidase SppA
MEIARESIFVSSLRSFCRMFFGLTGLAVALFFFSTLYSVFTSPYMPQEKTTLSLLPDLEGSQELTPLHSPAVLQINVDGVIGIPDKLTGATVENLLLDSRRGLLQNDRVKAVLLRINSPGGTVVDSDAIYRSLMTYKAKYKIPIFAYIDGTCASGGMYVACAAEKIFASPSSVIGSVGVLYGPLFNFSEAMTKLGIQSKTMTEGLDKDSLNPFRPWKPGEGTSLQAIMAFLYQRFVTVVTEARPRLDKQKLVAEYGANIFDGPGAEERGYIDFANADYATALRALLSEAKIDPTKPYQVVELNPRVSLLDALAKSSLMGGTVKHSLDMGARHALDLRDQFSYLFAPEYAP